MDDNLGETETTVGETIADPSLADVTDLMQDVRLQDLSRHFRTKFFSIVKHQSHLSFE
jgi:hypothetical protein